MLRKRDNSSRKLSKSFAIKKMRIQCNSSNTTGYIKKIRISKLASSPKLLISIGITSPFLGGLDKRPHFIFSYRGHPFFFHIFASPSPNIVPFQSQYSSIAIAFPDPPSNKCILFIIEFQERFYLCYDEKIKKNNEIKKRP